MELTGELTDMLTVALLIFQGVWVRGLCSLGVSYIALPILSGGVFNPLRLSLTDDICHLPLAGAGMSKAVEIE